MSPTSRDIAAPAAARAAIRSSLTAAIATQTGPGDRSGVQRGRIKRAGRQQFFHVLETFQGMLARIPKPDHAVGDAQAQINIVVQRPFQSSTQVIVLLLHAIQPFDLTMAAEFRLSALSQSHIPAGMSFAHGFVFARIYQFFQQILSDGIQQMIAHAVAGVFGSDDDE